MFGFPSGRKRFLHAAALLAAATALGGCEKEPAGPVEGFQIVSTFDTNDEGWTVSGDAQGGTGKPVHHASGGNPGGNVSAVDNHTGGTWYWRAPAQYRGDMSGAYRGVLKFDLKQSATARPFADDDVVLTGNNTALVYRTRSQPGTAWTTFRVRLDESAGWVDRATGKQATRRQMQSVLSSLSDLLIRGEYQDGVDQGWLDNVLLGAE